MIVLYGSLRKKFGKTIGANVNSVQELMKAAEALRPGFGTAIKKDGKYHIRRGSEFMAAADVPENEVEMKFSDDTWHVLPLPVAYSGALRVIVGVVLIAASWYAGGAAGWSYLGAQGFGMATASFGAGVSLAVGGIASMLSPVPKMGAGDSADKKASYIFDGPTNRAAAGAAIPLIYGFDVYVGSVFVSGELTVERVW